MNTLDKLSVQVERVDDIPVIYGMLKGMGVQEAIDKTIRPHGNWQGLSPGWLILLWLVHILSEQNHLMKPVQLWASRHVVTQERLTEKPVRELDFTDNRLAMCLRELSKKESGLELNTLFSIDSYFHPLYTINNILIL